MHTGQTEAMTKSFGEAVVVNSIATFSCWTNSSHAMRWNYYRPSGYLDTVYSGVAIRQDLMHRYVVKNDSESGRNDLVIEKVQASDAGMYSCLEFNSGSREANFELVVLDSNRSWHVITGCLACAFIILVAMATYLSRKVKMSVRAASSQPTAIDIATHEVSEASRDQRNVSNSGIIELISANALTSRNDVVTSASSSKSKSLISDNGHYSDIDAIDIQAPGPSDICVLVHSSGGGKDQYESLNPNTIIQRARQTPPVYDVIQKGRTSMVV
jgi:hypothetical protein